MQMATFILLAYTCPVEFRVGLSVSDMGIFASRSSESTLVPRFIRPSKRKKVDRYSRSQYLILYLYRHV